MRGAAQPEYVVRLRRKQDRGINNWTEKCDRVDRSNMFQTSGCFLSQQSFRVQLALDSDYNLLQTRVSKRHAAKRKLAGKSGQISEKCSKSKNIQKSESGKN